MYHSKKSKDGSVTIRNGVITVHDNPCYQDYKLPEKKDIEGDKNERNSD